METLTGGIGVATAVRAIPEEPDWIAQIYLATIQDRPVDLLAASLSMLGADSGVLCVSAGEGRELRAALGLEAPAARALAASVLEPGDGRLVSAATDGAALTIALAHDVPLRRRSPLARALHGALAVAGSAARVARESLGEWMDTWALGFVSVGAGARIITANQTASSILLADDGLCSREGRLLAACELAQERIVELSSTSGERAALGATTVTMIDRCSGARPYVVTRLPSRSPVNSLLHARAPAMLLLDDPTLQPTTPAEVLGQLHGLTPAEARLSRALLSGLTLEEAASVNGVGRETVRTQLKKLLAKTGCRRQSELVLLFARGPAGLSWG